MSYTTYTTPALVIRSFHRGEANKVLVLLTRDHGLLKAQAQSLRSLSSKMRFMTQDYGLSDVTVVRGRQYWRLIGSHAGNHQPSSVVTPHLVRILALVERLVPAEIAHPDVYGDVVKSLGLQARFQDDVENLRAMEAITVARLLDQLGYWQHPEGEFDRRYLEHDLEEDLVTEYGDHATALIRQINAILPHTHL